MEIKVCERSCQFQVKVMPLQTLFLHLPDFRRSLFFTCSYSQCCHHIFRRESGLWADQCRWEASKLSKLHQQIQMDQNVLSFVEWDVMNNTANLHFLGQQWRVKVREKKNRKKRQIRQTDRVMGKTGTVISLDIDVLSCTRKHWRAVLLFLILTHFRVVLPYPHYKIHFNAHMNVERWETHTHTRIKEENVVSNLSVQILLCCYQTAQLCFSNSRYHNVSRN